MRLKFLFFPVVLVISLAIFIAYIWPDFQKIIDLNKENGENKAKLESINLKKDKIKQMAVKIASDTEGESFIKNYLPEKKVYEQIINRLNFLATDSGVSLIDISAASSAKSSQQSAAVKTGAASDSLNLYEVKVSINGDYPKIRSFLDQVHFLPLFNSIKSLDIYKREKGQNETASPNDLIADIVISFAYMEQLKPSEEEKSAFIPEPETYSTTVATLKAYVSQKTPDVVYEKKGKDNPFSSQ